MNNKTEAVAVYATFSDEYAEQRLKHYKYPLRLLLVRDITFALLKYVYKEYYGIEIDVETLNAGNFLKQKEYGGLRYAWASLDNSVTVAVGEKPLAIGRSIRSAADDWKPNADHLHANERKAYEQSGMDDDVLCSLLAQKEAYEKLRGIENPSNNPFDTSYHKEIDSTVEQYTLNRFDYDGRIHYFAVTGDATFYESDVEDIMKRE